MNSPRQPHFDLKNCIVPSIGIQDRYTGSMTTTPMLKSPGVNVAIHLFVSLR